MNDEIVILEGLGQSLRELRGHVNMTQREVCERAGIKASQLSRWENGHEKPTLDSVFKVLDALGRDLSDLQQVLDGTYFDRPGEDEGGDEMSRERHERVRAAYVAAWQTRQELGRLMSMGHSASDVEYQRVHRRERAALVKLLAAASGHEIDARQGYFAGLTIAELWGHFRTLEHRFPARVTAGVGEPPHEYVVDFAEERWGRDEVRRYLPEKEPAPVGDEAVAAALRRLERRLGKIETRLDQVERELGAKPAAEP